MYRPTMIIVGGFRATAAGAAAAGCGWVSGVLKDGFLSPVLLMLLAESWFMVCIIALVVLHVGVAIDSCARGISDSKPL